MRITLSKEMKKTIVAMLETGSNNGRISLKFPGITREQIQDIRDEINAGTPETKRKLKRDPLLGLYRQGDLEIYELYAAEYIRKAFQLITQDIGVKVMKWDGFIDVFAGKPIENDGELSTRIQNQYADWFDECTKRRIRVGPIIHLLTEVASLRDTDHYFAYRHGKTKEYVVLGLKLYVEMFKPRQGLDF